MELRFSSIKFPVEIKRCTRPLSDRHHYKANEFRTILNYLSYSLYKGFRYFGNIMKYVVFIRLLSQEPVLLEDIKVAQCLITEFVAEYEELYGIGFMSSNLHGHLHLPYQVFLYGPLNKISAYIFENKFKMTRTLFHGTRNFEGQIAHGINHSSRLKMETKNLRTNSKNDDICFFIDRHILKKKVSINNILLRPEVCSMRSLKNYERSLIRYYLNNSGQEATSSDLNLKNSSRAIIAGKEYHSLDYDNCFDTIDNHILRY